MFDYYYYLMNLAAEQSAEEPGGLLVRLPDRRSDRRRSADVFFALLSLENGAGISPAQQNALLEKAAGVYFSSSGSVTAGIRAAVEPINEFLYTRNLRGSGEGRPTTGVLNLGVLHAGAVTIAHAGPTHTFFLTSAQVTDNADPYPERGLGFSHGVNLRYFQQEINSGDIILFCPRPPDSWTPALLAGAPQLNRNILRRRLLHQVAGELRAAVIEFQPGNGELHPLRLRSTPVPPVTSAAPGATPFAVAPSAAAPIPQATPAVEAPITPAPEVTPAPAVEQPTAQPLPAPVRAESRLAGVQMARPAVEEPAATSAQIAAEMPRPVRSPRRRRSGFQAWLAHTIKSSRSARQKAGSSLNRFTARLLPENSDQLPHLSNLSLLLIAIAVPVLIVALATTIYIRSGRDEQHNALVYYARQIADQAATAVGADSQRFAWNEVLKQVSEAEKYGRSPASDALRTQAQQAIDHLDGVRRLDYKSALAGGFDSQVNFTRLVVSQAGDLYALDAVVGRVIRFETTSNGYVLDRAFTCGPNQIGNVIVGPLVDIVALPRNNRFNADIMGIDPTGTLILCGSGDTENQSALTLNFNSAWGKITAITLYDGSLYVLDPLNNVVWRFDSLSGGFANPPHSLDVVLQDLINAVDISTYEDDIFLLHSSGQITSCSYRSQFSWDMDCKEPAPFVITNSDGARVSMNTLDGTQLAQIQTTYPLEPSLFILDQASNSVYRLSVAMQVQYKMSPALNGTVSLPTTMASAFVVTPDQKIILAFADQLYIADLPLQ